MKPVTWRRVRELFERLDEVPLEGRRAWLDSECSNEPEVRAELERLALADAENSAWLAGEGEVGWLTAPPPAPLEAGSRLGPYQVRSLLGSGGMGTVYCAEQEQPRRLVALKTLRADIVDAELVRRFRVEAEVLGHLRHPGIAQVYEAGTDEVGGLSTSYLAMEFVEGARDLVTYAREEGLDRRARLELFLQVCDAVHHGHRKGVLHRDLKPGNLLVDAEGRPKVIDFGLARPLEAAGLELSVARTRFGEILGTLAYMSPEHVSGDTFEVDTRSDVFSLGCVLCELVCGSPPRDLESLPLPKAVRVIAEEEVSLEGRVSGELRWILEAALARDPARRYASVAAFAEDVQRLLRSEPVSVGPPSALYRVRRLARRHRAFLVGAAAVVIALSIGLVQALREAGRAERASEESERQAAVARSVSFFLVDLFRGVHAFRDGREARVVDALELAETRLPHLEDPAVRAVLQGIVGEGFLNVGELDRAEVHVEEAVAVLRERLPEESLFRMRTEALHADLLEQRERIDESIALSEELLPRLERVLGPEAETTQYLRYNLAVCRERVGDWARAEELFRRGLELVEAFDGGPGRSAAYVDLLQRVGALRGRQGDHEEAVRLMQESLDLAETVELPGELYVPTIQMNLATVLGQAGDLEGSLAILEEVADAYERLGAPPSNRCAIAFNRASVLVALDRPVEAYGQLAAAREVLREHWPEPGVREVTCVMLEAQIALVDEDPEYAEELANEALELCRRVLPEQPDARARALDLLARAELELDRAPDALLHAREAHGPLVAALGARHRDALRAQETLVRALAAEGETAEALRHARELVEATPASDRTLAQRRAMLEELLAD